MAEITINFLTFPDSSLIVRKEELRKNEIVNFERHFVRFVDFGKILQSVVSINACHPRVNALQPSGLEFS